MIDIKQIILNDLSMYKYEQDYSGICLYEVFRLSYIILLLLLLPLGRVSTLPYTALYTHHTYKKNIHRIYTHNFGGIRMTLAAGNNRMCVPILTQCHLSWKAPEPIYLLKGRIGYEYRVNIGRHSKTRGVQMHLTSVTKCT